MTKQQKLSIAIILNLSNREALRLSGRKLLVMLENHNTLDIIQRIASQERTA